MKHHLHYAELKCKHCKAHTMVRPSEVDERQNNRLRCPFCNAMKLVPTHTRFVVIQHEDGSETLQAVQLERVAE